jgi:hypothetical protein
MRLIAKNDVEFHRICEKGSFPYEWFDAFEKLEQPVPKREHFYNTLRQEELSETEYNEMLETCQLFNIKTFREYHDLYLKRDVYGLCDMFEAFRDVCSNSYGLDPCHYMGNPSLSWDAMLKHTQVRLEQITDADMYMFFEKGIRGGMSKSVLRYAKANNPYMNDFNPKDESSYLMYFDANNLYGQAMCRALPLKDFRWMSDHEMDVNTIVKSCQEWDDESQLGFTVEVDLEYPSHLHDEHNDLPLAPEHKCVKESEISTYSRKALQHLGGKFLKQNRKLIGSLESKKKYVIHVSALKFYLEQGLVLTNVTRGVSFVQRKWLEPYIEFNTQRRSLCSEDYEKDFYS